VGENSVPKAVTPMTRQVVGLFLLVLLLTAGSATSAPLTYNEAIDGDLTFFFPTTSSPPLVLGVGENHISGTLVYELGVVTDADAFAINVPAGLEVFRWGRSWNPVAIAPGTTAAVATNCVNWFDSPGVVLGGACPNLQDNLLQPGERDFSGFSQAFDDTYFFAYFFTTISGLPDSNPGGTFAYDFVFFVGPPFPSVVPEPTIVALLGLGVAARGVRQRQHVRH
jgi:hypothetical protein